MPIEPWRRINPATTPRQELAMVSPELPSSGWGAKPKYAKPKYAKPKYAKPYTTLE